LLAIAAEPADKPDARYLRYTCLHLRHSLVNAFRRVFADMGAKQQSKIFSGIRLDKLWTCHAGDASHNAE